VVSVVLTAAGAARADSILDGALQSVIRAHKGDYVKAGETTTGFLRRNSPRRLPWPLEANRCYKLLVVTNEKVPPYSVGVLSPDGVVLANLGTPARDLVVPFCTRVRGLHAFDLLGQGKDGDFALQLYAAPPPPPPPSATPPPTPATPTSSDAPPADPATGGAPPPTAAPAPPTAAPAAPAAPPPPPPDPMGDAADRVAARTAPGAQRLGKHLRGFESQGRGLDFQVLLEGGHCYLFTAVGSIGVRSLSLYLWDPAGKRITEVKDQPEPALQHCASMSGSYHLQTKFTKGGGTAVTGVYQVR
jgi:hypothetical protein